MPHGCDPAEALVYLRKRYEGRGLHLVRVGDAYAFRTAPDLGHLMRKETVEQRKLSRAAAEVLAANPQALADWKAGKQQAMGFLVGQAMKASKGRGDAALLGDLIRTALDR